MLISALKYKWYCCNLKALIGNLDCSGAADPLRMAVLGCLVLAISLTRWSVQNYLLVGKGFRLKQHRMLQIGNGVGKVQWKTFVGREWHFVSKQNRWHLLILTPAYPWALGHVFPFALAGTQMPSPLYLDSLSRSVPLTPGSMRLLVLSPAVSFP